LHELFSTFPFSYYGRILSLVLVLCETGHEKGGECRRGEHYITDSKVDEMRLSLILQDIIRKPDPPPVDSCDFGQGRWSDLNSPSSRGAWIRSVPAPATRRRRTTRLPPRPRRSEPRRCGRTAAPRS